VGQFEIKASITVNCGCAIRKGRLRYRLYRGETDKGDIEG
jgi:hypothetical protein